MAHEPSTGWRELKRPKQATCPKVFYNYVTIDNTIDLQLTDLVLIWHCRLNQQEIIQASKSQDVSIDPSGSDSQFQVLLQRLEQALGTKNNTLYHAKDISSQIVYVKTRMRLPSPLKPLIWTFELAPQSASDLAEHLLRPSLFEASVSKQKISSLFTVIKEKDHLLSRLLEKLESSATDLSLIFPGITGLKTRRGRVTVAEAKGHVPGMKEFDPTDWLSRFQSDGPYAGYDQKGINNLVAGCVVCPDHSAKEHLDWLRKLPRKHRSKVSFYEFSSDEDNKDDESIITSDDISNSSDDDFERQRTPRTKKTRRKGHGAGSAEGEDETPPVVKAKLGRIGAQPQKRNTVGNKPATVRQSSSISKSSHDVQDDVDVSTASESESSSKHQVSQPIYKKSASRSRSTTKSPPKPNTVSNTGRLSTSSTSSTEDEDEDDLDSQPKKPSQRSSNPARNPPSQRQRSPSPPSPATDLPPPPRPTLRRLGTIGSRSSQSQASRTNSMDVHSSPHRHTNTADVTKSPSMPLTPRRLGRIGASQSVTPSPLRFKGSPIGQGKTSASHDDSDATESASEPGSPTPSRRRNSVSDDAPIGTRGQRRRVSSPREATGGSSTNKSEPPKPATPETAEEKANRRREELKRKIDPGQDGGAAAKRKKRKF